MLKRPVNVGFSGGEKKRNEMVQMGILNPKFAILDETDSGLDIDALRIVGDGINRIMRAPDKAVLLITHYQRLLDYVQPDRVHVLADGRIVRSGGPELALELEREGYAGWTHERGRFLLRVARGGDRWRQRLVEGHCPSPPLRGGPSHRRWGGIDGGRSGTPFDASGSMALGDIDALRRRGGERASGAGRGRGSFPRSAGARLLFVDGVLDESASDLGPVQLTRSTPATIRSDAGAGAWLVAAAGARCGRRAGADRPCRQRRGQPSARRDRAGRGCGGAGL